MVAKKTNKRAAVYDRWLSTMGGGEQVAFAFAEVLRDLGYQTDILTHKQFDLEVAKRKMNLDLNNIKMRYLPHLQDFQLSHYTEQYDVFTNHSHLDYVPNLSKHGILYVSFPSKINVSFYEYLKRAHIVPSLRSFFVYPSQFSGFKYDEFRKGIIHKWLGRKSRITFNKPVKKIKLEFYHEQLALSCLDQIKFYWGKKLITPNNREIKEKQNLAFYSFEFEQEQENTLAIKLPDSEFSGQVSLVRIWIFDWRYLLYNLFKTIFPKWEMRLHGGPSITRLSDIESYHQVFCNSKFTQKWINHYWKLKSEVLYPPVNIRFFKPARKKRNLITNIGRFFVGGHSKKQLDLVRVFKQLVDNGVKNWELHLVGSVAEGFQHQHYFKQIQDEAQGYPVVFHIDANFKELKRLLQESKIYWHATGLDKNENKKPATMEHFGITTVEAMASGCVPIVINKGGQPEIITTDSGILWNTRKELLDSTHELIKNPKKLKFFSKGAVKRSQYFSKENFIKRLKNYLPNP